MTDARASLAVPPAGSTSPASSAARLRRRPWFALALAITASASASADDPPTLRFPADVGPPPLAVPGRGEDGLPEIREDWDGFGDQRWAGPLFRPNRLQDWRVTDHRVWCTEPRLRLGVRTLMGVATRIDPAADLPDGTVVLRTRLRTGAAAMPGSALGAGAADLVTANEPAGPVVTAWRGWMVGVGGPEVDPWISGLVHQRPAPGGGMLAVVDAAGRPSFRDFETAVGGAGRWTLGGQLAEDEATALPGLRVTAGEAAIQGAAATDLHLDLEIIRRGERGYAATLRSRLPDGRLVATAHLDEVPPHLVIGAVGLVSHGRDGGPGVAHWFDDLRIAGPTLVSTGARFGPVVAVHHLTDGDDVRATIQCVPMGPGTRLPIRFVAAGDDAAGPPWQSPSATEPDADAWAAGLDLPRTEIEAGTGRAAGASLPFRLIAGDASTLASPSPGSTVGAGVAADGTLFRGVIRGAPAAGAAGAAEPLVIASLNCQKSWTGVRAWNASGVWYPHAEVTEGLLARDPDMLVFTGDQLYEGDLTPAQREPIDDAIVDYLDKWLRFCTSFAPATATRPTITIPDDHDVYHGNIWGDGGVRAVADRESGTTAQDAGGYVMPLRFVQAVHRTQVGHLRPERPEPIGMGIVPWTSRVRWGGVDLAIVSDRMFKSPPRRWLPAADVRNGWARAPGFDAVRDAGAPAAAMLGTMQEAFLQRWAEDFEGDIWAKVLVSASPLANVATLPPGGGSGAAAAGAGVLEPGAWPRDWTLAADMDSGGWPREGRDRAIAAARVGGAIHLCGDQHLGMLLQYGIDRPRDAGLAFCSPAIANAWPRRWYPPMPGERREPGMPPWTGDFRDGFGNLVTVWAVANPARVDREPAALHETMPGWGALVLDRRARTVTFECFPRWSRPGWGRADAGVQYPGWPRTMPLLAGLHGGSGWAMPPIVVEDVDEPVLVVRDAAGAAVAAARLGPGDRLPVPGAGPWTIEVGEPGTDRWRRFGRFRADPSGEPSEVFIVRWE